MHGSRMDSDVAEALDAHANELAAFDAQLYPKPWGYSTPTEYVQRAILKHQEKYGGAPRRIHCSTLFMREMLAGELGQRRAKAQADDLAMCSVYGVPMSIDSDMEGFTMRIEARNPVVVSNADLSKLMRQLMSTRGPDAR